MNRNSNADALQKFLERVSALFNGRGSTRDVSDLYSENAQLTVKRKCDRDYHDIYKVSGMTDLQAYFNQQITERHNIVEARVEVGCIF
uniref:Uncharacterized protein n=1 Tax=Plectus sambesii TaxID=2011161 RepID=A0A914XP52_9BILA